ncbi:hypothetical protein QUW15_01180 [Desulfovibrio piger]|nr:hypothetical protein [Desulfovibrio piger]
MPADIEINIPSPPPEVLQGLQQALGGMGTEGEATPAPASPAPAAPAIPAPPPDVLHGLQNSLDIAARNSGGNEGPSVMERIWNEGISPSDTLLAAGSGILKGADETFDFFQSVGKFVPEVASNIWDSGSLTEGWKQTPWRVTPDAEKDRGLWGEAVNYKPDTVVGEGVKELARFVAGFVGAGKALKAANILQKAGAGTALARSSVQGMTADFFGSDGLERNLGDVLEQFPQLQDTALTFLAHDKDDSEIEGRLKNTMEGLGIGLAFEGVLWSLKALRSMRKASSPEEAADALVRSVDELENRPAAAQSEATSPQPTGAKDPAFEESAPREKIWDGKEPSKDDAVTELPPENLLKPDELLGEEDVLNMVRSSRDEKEAVQGIIGNVNYRRIVFSSPSTSHTLKNLAEALADKTLKNAGVEHHNDMFAEAMRDLKRSGLNADMLLMQTARNAEDLHRIGLETLQARSLYNFMLTDMERLVTKFDAGTITDIEKAELKALHVSVQQFQKALADVRTETGRATSLWKKVVDDQTVTPFAFKDGEKARAYLADLGVDKEELKAIAKTIREARGDHMAAVRTLTARPSLLAFGFNAIRSFFIHNILSGPVTQTINATGNAINALDIPLSRIIGGAVKGNKYERELGYNMLKGMYANMGVAWRHASRAFRTRQTILEGGRSGTMFENGASMIIESPRLRDVYMARKANPEEGLNPFEEYLSNISDWGRKWLFGAHNVMTGVDEFFRQLSYRGDLYARAVHEGVKNRHLSGETLDAYVRSVTDKAADEYGRVLLNEAVPENILKEYEDAYNAFRKARKPAEKEAARTRMFEAKKAFEAEQASIEQRGLLREQALETARRVTFTQDPGEGTRAVINAVNRIPGMRYVCPFIRTPVNIVKDFYAHTAFNGIHRGLAEESSRELAERNPAFWAETTGRILMGMTPLSLIVGYHLMSAPDSPAWLTGAPPEGKREREKWYAVGNQPYSVRIGGTWVGYKRLGPLGLMLMVAAIFSDAIRYHQKHGKDIDYNFADNIWYNMVGSAVQNMSDQTFFSGLQQVVELISKPRTNAPRYFGNLTSNMFIPYAGAGRNILDMADPYMRKAKNFLDYWAQTTGIGRFDIPIRYNWITGKPEEKRLFPEYHKDPVMAELWELSDKVTGGPTDTLKGVKLDDARMSELYRLHGTVRIGGKTMYERLGELIANPRYQRLPYAPDGVPGPRDRAVNKVIDAYRRMAVRELLMTDTPLRGQVLAQNVVKKGARGGAVSRDNATEVREALQNLLGGIRPDGSAAAAASPGPEHDAAMQRLRDLVATRR